MTDDIVARLRELSQLMRGSNADVPEFEQAATKIEQLMRERAAALVDAEEWSDRHKIEAEQVDGLCIKLSQAHHDRDAAVSRAEAAEEGVKEYQIKCNDYYRAMIGQRERAEAAERERDEARDQRDCREHEKTALRNCLRQAESDLEAAEAKVAKLRETLEEAKPYVTARLSGATAHIVRRTVDKIHAVLAATEE